MMKRWLLAILCLCSVTGCSRYQRIGEPAKTPDPIVVGQGEEETSPNAAKETAEETTEAQTEPEPIPREPVKVKGIYVSAFVAGTDDMMENLIQKIDETEINAVVIDVKNDDGKITCQLNSSVADEIGAQELFIGDVDGLIKKLKEHHIYVIARVVAFRDPYLAEKKPEWSLKLADGRTFRDKQGLAWVNPYKQEVWDYLVEIGKEAARIGFDEVQFDYIRFSTERGIDGVVFDEADTRGRSKTDVITEFISYAYERLKDTGVFVSADVFGTIIGSSVDAEAVGQIYGDMAKYLDYICPMIYPSHYGDGNFGIEHPDMEPYDTILAALHGSKAELDRCNADGAARAAVRPWLQAFTASYLKNHIQYGPEQIRDQIQAVYDAGYDEWILWDAACKYSWDGLKTPQEAEEESEEIAMSREVEEEAAQAAAGSAENESDDGSNLQNGPAPELSKLPELPEGVAPAGPTEPGDKVIIPQMQME